MRSFTHSSSASTPHISHTPSSLDNLLTSFINVSTLAPFLLPLPSPHPSLSRYLFPGPLSFALLSHSLALAPSHASLSLRVVSQVDWPLNIIITDSCMNKYNRLFSFLLQLKHMVWSLREVWFHLKRTGEGGGKRLIWARLQTPPLTLRREELRFFSCCASTVHKIFIKKNAAIPLCFIYTKHISDQWDCCKTLCFTGLDSIDQ